MRIAQILAALAVSTCLAAAAQAQSEDVMADVEEIISTMPVGSRPAPDETRVCFRAVDQLLEMEDTAGAARLAGFLQDFCYRGLASELEREGLYRLLSDMGLEAPDAESDLAGLAQAIAPCLNVGSLNLEAPGVAVVVAFDATHDGRVVAGSIVPVGSADDMDASAEQAFQAVLRAIIRCGVNGYPQIWQPGRHELSFWLPGTR